MELSSELISQFVKATKDNTKSPSESTVYGTTVKNGETIYVRLDGSDHLTPISTTADVTEGERVTVLIKNHTATITGNMSSPAAKKTDVDNAVDQISEFEIVMAYKVTTEDLETINATINNLKAITAKYESMETVNAEIENLRAKYAELQYVSTDEFTAIMADIESLEAIFGDFTSITTEDLEAVNADIDQLRGYTADFTYVSAEILDAFKASIKELDADKLTAEQADIKYANIDFSNIDNATMEYFYAKSGLIDDVVIGDSTITGRLIGVTIVGDLIEGGTIVAEKLVILGEDGLYYKLNTNGMTTEAEQTEYNSINGSIITAKSVTAEKINVHDLVAFDATIGGFTITDSSLYSEVKDSDDNTTRGIYFDTDGQVNIGDTNNYIKYLRDEDGNYKLTISAESILYSLNGSKYSLSDLGSLIDYVKIGTYEDEPCIELGEGDSDFKLLITNTRILFKEGSLTPAYITNQALNTDKVIVKNELHIGNEENTEQPGVFVWKMRANGNMGLVWKGASD